MATESGGVKEAVAGSGEAPDDDAILAVAAHADLIVTGDKDLLVLGSDAGIPIVSPAEALVRIAGETP